MSPDPMWSRPNAWPTSWRTTVIRLIEDQPHPAASTSTTSDRPEAEPSPAPAKSVTDALMPDVSAPASVHSDFAWASAEESSAEESSAPVTGVSGRLAAVIPGDPSAVAAGSVSVAGVTTDTCSSPEMPACSPSAMGHEMDAWVPPLPPTVVHWLVESALASAARASCSRASASALACWAARASRAACAWRCCWAAACFWTRTVWAAACWRTRWARRTSASRAASTRSIWARASDAGKNWRTTTSASRSTRGSAATGARGAPSRTGSAAAASAASWGDGGAAIARPVPDRSIPAVSAKDVTSATPLSSVRPCERRAASPPRGVGKAGGDAAIRGCSELEAKRAATTVAPRRPQVQSIGANYTCAFRSTFPQVAQSCGRHPSSGRAGVRALTEAAPGETGSGPCGRGGRSRDRR